MTPEIYLRGIIFPDIFNDEYNIEKRFDRYVCNARGGNPLEINSQPPSLTKGYRPTCKTLTKISRRIFLDAIVQGGCGVLAYMAENLTTVEDWYCKGQKICASTM